MNVETDVVVVGGSVAGAATALHLSRAGASVVVLDRAQFPREKVCGEGLMPHGVAELARLGVVDRLASCSRPFRGIVYHVGEVSAVGEFPDADTHPGLGVRRFGLDRALFEACAAAPGVDLRAGVEVRRVVTTPEAAIIETSGGTVRARAVVGADGLMSRVRRDLGLKLETSRAPRYGARFHARLRPGRRAPAFVEVFVGPRCEFYITPTGDGEVNVALLCGKRTSQRFAGDLPGGFQTLIEDVPEVRELLDGAEPATPAKLTGPLRQPTSGVVADRAVLVGDAAGFVDAITGEGMSIALVSARLAADALIAGLARDRLRATDLMPYQAARGAFSRDLVLLSEIVVWWLSHPWLARWVVRNLARHPQTFQRMLAVNLGMAPLLSVGPRDWVRIAAGI
jgi:flavin-dependent dehydrogenase